MRHAALLNALLSAASSRCFRPISGRRTPNTRAGPPSLTSSTGDTSRRRQAHRHAQCRVLMRLRRQCGSERLGLREGNAGRQLRVCDPALVSLKVTGRARYVWIPEACQDAVRETAAKTRCSGRRLNPGTGLLRRHGEPFAQPRAACQQSRPGAAAASLHLS